MVAMLIMGFKMRYLDLKRKISSIRMLAIQGIAEAGSGHPGASLSAAELMGVLYFRKMKHSPKNPVGVRETILSTPKDTRLRVTSQHWP